MTSGGGWSLLAVVLLVGLYLRRLAGRLDRLHVRVDAARDALDAQLVRRTAAALELAHAGLLDPATSVLLAEEAYGAQTAEHDRARARRERAHRRAARGDPRRGDRGPGRRVRPRRRSCSTRCARRAAQVVLARRFYNDAVRSTQGLRDRRLVRWLRLAGTAPYPRTFEMDDLPPQSLSVPR